MRGASIPSWTFLREPSASSGAPSDDDPLGHSSQEVVDELNHNTPPSQPTTSSRRMAPPPVPVPSSVRHSGGGRPSGNYRTQPSGSAPRRPMSPSRTRRPHSGTDEEEERPRKKKRDLHNTGQEELQRVHLSASQRENATRQRHFLPNAAARQHRRATFAGPFLSKNERPNAGPLNHQNEDKRNGGSSSSTGKHATALSQAQARAGRSSMQSAGARGPVAGPSRPIRGASGSATQPTPSQRSKSAFSPGVIDLTDELPEAPASSQPHHKEVIEILDSDEELPPPPPPASETVEKAIKSEPKKAAVIPRRNKEHPRTEPPKTVPRPNEVIVLDSSDDDEPPPRLSIPLRNSTSAQPKEPPPEQRKAPSPAPSSPLMECKPSPPASPPLWNQGQLSDDRMTLSPPIPLDQLASPVASPLVEDVEMVQEPPIAIDTGEVSASVDFEIEAEEMQILSGEVLRSSPGTMPEQEPTIAPVMDSPVDVPASLDKELLEAGDAGGFEHASASQPEPDNLAGNSLSAEAVLRDGSSTQGSASPHQVEMVSISQTSRVAESAQPPPTLSTASSPTVAASLRAETASPVSRVLDPGLQGLAITDSTPDSTDHAMGASGFSSPSSTAVSIPISRKRLLKPTDRSPWKMHGAAHGGPTGWFNHNRNRLSQKRRSRSQSGLQNRLSKSPAPHSPLATSSASSPAISIAVGASPRELLKESPKATSPTANTPDALPKGISAQEKPLLSSVPSQPRQDKDKAALDSPVSQRINPDEAPGVQSNVPQQRPPQSPEPHAPVEEGQAPSEATATEIPKSHDADGRNATPPADNPSPAPLGPTLSQIIRTARNENARRNVIDLTFDKSDDDRGGVSPSRLADKPVPPSRTDGPPLASPAENAATSLPPSTPSTLQHLSPDKAPVEALVKHTVPPLPRNIRRGSAPDALKSPPMVPATQPSATFSRITAQDPSPSRLSAPSASPSVPVVIPTSFVPVKHVLPRRPQVMRGMPSTQAAMSRSLDAPRIPTTPLSSVSVPEDRMNIDNSGTSASASIPPLSPTIPSSCAESPPHSDSPHTDVTEEEECRSLIYPSTTPEESPEAEVPDEDEFPIRPLAGRRTRSQASSEASSGPRRSARLSSSSASSSVEPEELSRPRQRLRPRVSIHTASDDEIASQGGISRFRTRYSRAFEAAGFESLSWKKDRQRVAKEFAPVTQSADNIPHDLHDRLNALPPSARHASNLQAIFEAEIAANTAEDEPNAPPIRVVNNVDDEPTPPMEFYYSNLMWHSRNVPKPDFEALKGCGCIGACNPNLRTCACVRRQREHCKEMAGFLYDQKGRLKTYEYPIFECNINCGCSEDCPNRVIQHGRRYELEIRKTESKGWGIFAGPKKIPGMSFIGVYAGEYLTDEEAEKRGLHYNSFGRTYLFDLDFWHIKKHEDDPPKYTVDAYHAGNFTRYLNHSCDPNCAIVPGYINESNIDKPLLTMFTIRDVEPNEELCFNYNGADDEKVDPDKDDAVYVRCQCGADKCKGYVWK